ncbi:MAG: LuxR C-terminal-related transcriptional regulator [Marmoricola sp.]
MVGPPGAGKTLVLRHLAAGFESACWVDARGLRTTDKVLTACLQAMGGELAPGDRLTGAVGGTLDDTDAVLVLDAVDLEADGLGEALQEMLDTTSRGRLALTALAMAGQPGERVVRVGPLPVPKRHEPLVGQAVDLLAARVEAAGGRPLDLVADEAGVRRLLVATGGLPLLIEQLAVQVALVGLAGVAPATSLSGAVEASYALLDLDHQVCFRRLAQMSSPVGIDALAEIVGVGRSRAAELAAGLARHSLLEVRADGRFDLLSPMRRHGVGLGAHTDDAEQVTAGLLRWADRVAPQHYMLGAADAPWLADLPVMRAAISAACARDDTRDLGYRLANRVFSSLYTAMRAGEALEIMEEVLLSGDGPADIGAQVARRAGIAASEVRGTYEGLWLLDRADEYAPASEDPARETMRTAAIRAEMHLDAGSLRAAEAEAGRAIELDCDGRQVEPQARRTLADIQVSRGDFAEARHNVELILSRARGNRDPDPDSLAGDLRWITLSARTLAARVALEQGRLVEAGAAVRAVVDEATAFAEDRVRLLADTLLRQVDPTYEPAAVEVEALPWAVRLPVVAEEARTQLLRGDTTRAAGLAADVVVLADSCRLGRDAVAGRLALAHALLARGDVDQAATTFLLALAHAHAMPLPLRVADALDGLAAVAGATGRRRGRQLAATALAIRAPRLAVPWGCAASVQVGAARTAPEGWVVDGLLTDEGRHDVAGTVGTPCASSSTIDQLTRAERQVAELVGEGLTSRQIATELFVSPRTVDAHLANIYRKLEIGSRARLAAMMAGSG